MRRTKAHTFLADSSAVLPRKACASRTIAGWSWSQKCSGTSAGASNLRMRAGNSRTSAASSMVAAAGSSVSRSAEQRQIWHGSAATTEAVRGTFNRNPSSPTCAPGPSHPPGKSTRPSTSTIRSCSRCPSWHRYAPARSCCQVPSDSTREVYDNRCRPRRVSMRDNVLQDIGRRREGLRKAVVCRGGARSIGDAISSRIFGVVQTGVGGDEHGFDAARQFGKSACILNPL